MPNWIEGNMRIRGAARNVFTFLTEGFEYVEGKWVIGDDGTHDYVTVRDNEKINVRKYSDDDVEADITIPDGCHLVGSRRAFTTGSDVWIEDITTMKEITVCIDMKQAWGWIDEDFYKSLSDKYHIDIRCLGWEQGMQYRGELIVLRGEEPVYEETKYDDWVWEAECPMLGG